MIKKPLTLAIALFMVFGVFTATAQAVSSGSSDDMLTSGDYEYIVLDDGTAEIQKYKGSDSVITIPSELDGKMLPAFMTMLFSIARPLPI